MSLESISTRISEIESRIQSLSPAAPGFSLSAVQKPQNLLDGSTKPLQSRSPLSSKPLPLGISAPGEEGCVVKPFDVTLAEKQGQVSLRPTGASNVRRFSPQIESLIEKYSTQYGLDSDVVRAVIVAESDGNVHERSNKGAMGLMQLMPDEVKSYGIADPYDPEQNIMGGTRQLAEKLKIFNGDLSRALAAYNAGTGAVKKYDGIPPYRETQNYVSKIMKMLGR